MASRNFETKQLEIGRIFEDKYRIVREIGRGGFGMVYLAHQEAMERSVALKVLKSGLEEEEAAQAKERFLREVRVISSLRHPNTVTIHDFGETASGILYMVLEYIEGESLDVILQKEGAQQPERALHFSMQIARSLSEAHRHGVVHRDLKPANIMVTHLETEGDFVKVLDFGVARLLKSEQRDLTQSGLPDDERQVLGTPRYMSPEQVRGQSVDNRTDLYCLGLLIYEMLVGEPAVQGDTAMALITQHISPEPLAMEGLRALPDDIAEVVRRCSAKSKDQRYDSAEELVTDLRQVMSMFGKQPRGDAAASSDSFAAASMSFESSDPIVTDYQAQLNDLQDGEDIPLADESNERPDAGDSWDPQPQTPRSPQPVVETGSASNSDGPDFDQSPAAEFGSADQFDPTEPKDRPDGFLPPPPADDSDFRPEADKSDGSGGRSSARAKRGRQQADDGRALTFVFDTLKLLGLGALALFGVYVSFLLIGSMFEGWLAGSLRMLAALSLALAIPILTAIEETSDRERFRVMRRRVNRIARTLVSTCILSLASGTLVSIAMPKKVVTELRTHPNWFLSETNRRTSTASLNKSISRRVADVVATATGALGLYTPGPFDKEPTVPVDDTPEPPPPTRPGTSESPGEEDEPSDSDQRQPRSAIELLKNPPDEESGESSGENEVDSSGSKTGSESSGDYQKW